MLPCSELQLQSARRSFPRSPRALPTRLFPPARLQVLCTESGALPRSQPAATGTGATPAVQPSQSGAGRGDLASGTRGPAQTLQLTAPSLPAPR